MDAMISRSRKAVYAGLMLMMLVAVVEGISLALFVAATGKFLSYTEVQGARQFVRNGEDANLIAAEDRGPVPSWQVLHPYLGFVLHPSHRKNGSNDYGFVGALPPFEVGGGPQLRADRSRPAVVAVVGGSVAQNMTHKAGELLGTELSSSACFEGREVSVVNLALPGFKQPQQLLTLNYFLSVGAVIDVVISLDGFNEIALPIAENKVHGVYPFYPRNWKFHVAGLKDVTTMRGVGEVEFWRSARKELAAIFSSRVLRYSATANTVWLYADRAIEHTAAMKMVDLTLAQSEGSGTFDGYMKRGPTRDYPSESLRYADLTESWERSTHLMHGVSRASGIAPFSFLQPNQRVPDSKVFAPGEREVALPRRQAYDAPTRTGYPGLIEAAARMQADGLAFDDLTMVFRDIEETVYIDGCCHVNELGSKTMAVEIARLIRDRFTAGEPCPSFR
ncbi:MAG: hypothetical protein ACI8W3_003611 [Myxococcota bacterium]|jgi:hypothetical protein